MDGWLDWLVGGFILLHNKDGGMVGWVAIPMLGWLV